MTKRCPSPKRPQGRPPAGAVLVDGKWQLTEQSVQIAVERLLRHRERNRIKRDETRDMLRRGRPELFAHVSPAELPQQTALSPARSDKGTLWQYQKKD